MRGMSAIGTKRTSACALHMSALEVKRTKVYGDLNSCHRLGPTISPFPRRPPSAVTNSGRRKYLCEVEREV